MDSAIVNDSLNLRDLVEQITDYAKVNNCEPKNAKSLFRLLFRNINPPDASGTKKKADADTGVDDGMISNLQKLLSGNVPIDAVMPLSDAIMRGAYDKQFRANLLPIVTQFENTPDSYSFFSRLAKQISPRFFDSDEIDRLKACISAEDYSDFLQGLFKHAFKTLYNIPAFFCERLLDEALTYDYDSPVRYEIMRVAARSNKRAACEYGNYLAKNGPYDLAFQYMMKALPLPSAIWNIAFLIETHKLSRDAVRQFQAAVFYEEKILDETSAAFPEIADIVCTEKVPAYDDMVIAFRSYAFLASKCNFFKGYNSMAKLLSSTRFTLKPKSNYDKESLVKEYYCRAIAGGTPMALNNVGIALMDKVESGVLSGTEEHEHELLTECLTIASDYGMANANYRLARYMEYFGNASNEEVIKQYQRVIALDIDNTRLHGLAYYSLGMLETNANQRRDYFKQALACGHLSAIVNLMNEDYIEMTQSDQPEYWFSEIWSLYNRYRSKLTDEQRRKVEQLVSSAERFYSQHDNRAAISQISY